MRTSQWFLTTSKEIPADAELISHQLMLRAGMIKKLASGLYSWLPLGLKVLHKVENIIREEMLAINAIEVLLPAIQPAELWQETGRWDAFGGQLLKIIDNNKRNYCFGPTHEEVITDIVRHELKSYKQLPITLFQIQTKFRDEIRPRFGVMRAREFIMKDAYSFHLSMDCLENTYTKMYEAYSKIFDRINLNYRAVEADTGAIGGAKSHEFQVLADSGEDIIFYSNWSDYAANIEQAASFIPQPNNSSANLPTPTIVDTPGQKTIEAVSKYLNTAAEQSIKIILIAGKKDPIVALALRGDDELNEVKASKHPLIKSPLTFVSEELIAKQLKVPVGYIGPLDLNIPIIADFNAVNMQTFVCGANIKDKHYINAHWNEKFHYTHSFDLRKVKEGDASPDGKGILKMCRGIEVGHIFQLGDKYSIAMNAKVTDAQGISQPLIMGCYGIGVSRIVAAIIEQHHDKFGIIWPTTVAPFLVSLIPINMQNSTLVKEKITQMYEALIKFNIDVLLDDRDERPGILFADNDLIGIPHRFVFSDKHLCKNLIEYKNRKTHAVELIAIDKFIDFVRGLG